MRIISIHIDEFGMLENRDFVFAPGMNILEGHNESGKSTLQAFIKFMLYGLPGRGVGDAPSERMRRLNWRTGRAAGNMTVDVGGRTYRIERALSRTVSGSAESGRESFTESLQIVDLESGSPLPRGTQPGEHFLGVPGSVFESTAFVRQLGCTGVDGAGVSEALENLMTSASESSNTARALTRLDSARKALLHKTGRGGEIYALQAERTAVVNRLNRAKLVGSERIAAQTLIDGLKKTAGETREKLNRLRICCDAAEAQNLLRRFENLHALEKKTAELRGELEALYTREGREGFFPDRAYAASLRDLERRIAGAEAEVARRETELARMRYEQPGDRSRAEHAAEIRTAGGADALRARHAELTHGAKFMRGIAVLCLIVGCLAVLGAIALAFIVPSFVGYEAALVGIPFLAGGAACLFVAHQRKGALADLCRRFGLSKTVGGDAFAAWLNSCFAEEAQLTGYAEVLEQVEGELDERRAVLDAYRREAFDLLGRWKIRVADGGLGEELSAAIPRAEQAADAADLLRRDLAKYEATCTNTAEELAEYDENELLRRVAAVGENAGELNITALRRERDFLTQSLASVEEKRIETEKKLIALEATAEDPVRLAADAEELDRRIAALIARHDAIRLAAEALTEAAESLRRGVLPRLRARAGKFLSEITDGRYAGIGLGREMTMSVERDAATHSVELLSSGTADAAYLALRLALAELLFPNEQPPILLDESLAQLDNDRASALLAMLKVRCAEGAQCLIFTCHPREAELVEAERILL